MNSSGGRVVGFCYCSLLMLSFLPLCARYLSNAFIIVALLYHLNFFLNMSNTLATTSFSPQTNPVRKGTRVGIIILSALMKRLRLRELVIGQDQ